MMIISNLGRSFISKSSMSISIERSTGGYSAIDLFKFFASILVVAIHTHPFYNNQTADYIFTCICRIAVPFFFVFSSFIFYKRDNPNIKKYVVRLLKMYAFWFIVELPFIYERFFVDGQYGFIVNLCLFVKNLFLQNTFYASWYLTALGEGMLIVHWLHGKRKDSVLFVLSIVCVIFSLMGSTYSPFIYQLDCWKYWKYLFFIFTPSNSFIIAIPYCYIGMKLAENYSRLIQVRSNLCLVALLCMWSAEIYASMSFKNFEMNTDSMVTLFALAPILVLFLTCISVSMKANVQKFIRNSSILIYLIHGLVAHILVSYFSYSAGISLFLVTLVLSITLSLSIIVLSKYVKLLRIAY